MDELEYYDTDLLKLCIEIHTKTSEILNENNRVAYQIKNIIYEQLYEKIKEQNAEYYEDDFNIFVNCFNGLCDYVAKTYKGDEIESKRFKELLDLYHITSLDGETIYLDDDNNLETSYIYGEAAAIIFFYLANIISEKQISIADLGRYLPDNRGLDSNYEFANGLIVREVLSFLEDNKKYQNWHNVKGYIPFSSDLETLIFNNKYQNISYIEEGNVPQNLDAVIINVPYISIQYQYKERINLHLEGIGKIDFDRLEQFLKNAKGSLSNKGLIFLVFRMMDITTELDSGSLCGHYIIKGKAVKNNYEACPSQKEWAQLYNVFSKCDLVVDSIIQTDDQPYLGGPGFVEPDYTDSSGLIILRDKETNNKDHYSVINLIESFKEKSNPFLQKLVKAITRDTEIAENDLYAEYFDRRVEFNGFLIDTKNKELFYKKQDSQILQGFKKLSGRDLIKRINLFDINAYSESEETENAMLIPLNGDLIFAINATFSIDEFEEEIAKRFVTHNKLNWKGIPWYSFINNIIDDPLTQNDKREKLKEVLHRFNNTEWKKYGFFDIKEFGFEIKDDVIYYEDSIVQELEEAEERGYTDNEPYEWAIKKQILQANVFEVVLNPKVVLPSYLKLLFKTNISDIYFRELAYKDPGQSRIDVFLNTKLAIPPIELQKKLLQHDAFIENQKHYLESVKEMFYAYLGGGDYYNSDSLVTTFKFIEKYDYGTPEIMNSVFATIPQPIASILYLDKCEDNVARRNTNYYHLFEAISHFHATVSLSMIKRLPEYKEIFDKIMCETFLYNVSPNKREIRADFGLWTSLLRRIDEQCSDIVPFDTKINSELLLSLNNARQIRNKQMGHAPRWSDVKEKELNESLLGLAKDIVRYFSQLYSGYELILGPFAREEADTKEKTAFITCYKATGPNPRFAKERIEIKGYSRLLNHRLYLAEQGTLNNPIELLPLFNYVPLCEDDDKLKSLGYFHSANLIYDGIHDNRFVVWCSYDCGDCSISKKKYSEDPVTRDLINFLWPYWESKTKVK